MAMEDFKDAVYQGKLTDSVSNVWAKPPQFFSNTSLNIGFVGELGSGKSSLINTMRGLTVNDPGAAETGIQMTTLEVKEYPHPVLPGVTLWDLPGKGASPFGEDPFAKKVDLNRFDFFIIVGFQRFRSIHAELVHEIQKMGKRFYFVRTKADLDLEASRRQRPSEYNEEKILLVIRKDCRDSLMSEGVSNPQVFIVSNWESDRFDFPRLQETLKNDLLELKQEAFLLRLPTVCLPVLEKKKTNMKKKILIGALCMGVIAALPVPGLSFLSAIFLFMKFRSWCYLDFGLDDPSLTALAQLVGKTAAALKEAMKPLEKTTVALWRTPDLVGAAVMIAEYHYWHRFPVLGCLLSGGMSLLSSYFMLWTCASDGANDTQRVLSKALATEEKKSV
ncbi:interferon-inducible GTPase 5-like [Elgaria multicarinata webbii]|uniref:interferon-inducible GTPase 5-like n=1 Tax=Elgaria multicarinata webbii TaxID=159646 RepID=UPI002FCD2E5C